LYDQSGAASAARAVRERAIAIVAGLVQRLPPSTAGGLRSAQEQLSSR